MKLYIKMLLKVQVQGLDKSAEVVTMSQMLWTVLRELRQLVAGFTHCYESNIGVWCIKKPPQLSQLGASFKRVHGLLEKFAAVSSIFYSFFLDSKF